MPLVVLHGGAGDAGAGGACADAGARGGGAGGAGARVGAPASAPGGAGAVVPSHRVFPIIEP